MPLNHCSIEAARTAKEAFKLAFGATEGVVGVGLTRKDSGYALKVNLQSSSGARLPKQVEGVPLVIEVVGTVKPLAITAARAARPAKAKVAKR